MPAFFNDAELRVIAAACDRVIPPDDDGAPGAAAASPGAAAASPGAAAAGVADYIDTLLGAFTFDPPRVFAGGPFSGRHGGIASFDQWITLGAMEELAWRTRIEGSQGRPEREFNGPVVGWQEHYRNGLDALGPDFTDVDGDEQDRRLAATPDGFAGLLYVHTCEGMYGDPVYGGNRGSAGWQAINFVGDIQPRGYTDDEVERGENTVIDG